jgi:hypothetical protein
MAKVSINEARPSFSVAAVGIRTDGHVKTTMKI